MSRPAQPYRMSRGGWQQAIRVCPPEVQTRIERLPSQLLERLEELRFRLDQPLQLAGDSFDHFLHAREGVTDDPREAWIVTAEQLSRVMQIVTQSSLYAVEEDIRRGFVTMPGGHRVGVAGRVVLSETGAIRTIRSITSVNVRIAREHVGAANRVKTHLWRRDGDRPFNTLVISPPQCGKTTLLRDVVRQWSEGSGTPSGRGVKVVVVDERSEIAGCLDGIPQFCIGPRTDVLDGCPKAEGMLMAIRSLSPDLVVTDEIGRAEDRDAILEATHAGVSVVASAHAAGLEEWRARPYMRELFAARAFQRYVVLSRRLGPCTLEQILDADGNLVRSGNPVRSADSRTRAEPPC